MSNRIFFLRKCCITCAPRKSVEVRVPELIDISEDEYLISVALNRRQLSEGQRAALMVEYANAITRRHNKEKAEKARQAQLREQGYKDYAGLVETVLTQAKDEGAWKQKQQSKTSLRYFDYKYRSGICLWNTEPIFFLKKMLYNMCVRTGEHLETAKFNEFLYHTIFLESLCVFQIPELG